MRHHSQHPVASQLIRQLNLAPHPEGGHYRRFFSSSTTVQRNHDQRCALTAIYYLLTAHEVSRWHVVAADEIWHFYAGDPLARILHKLMEF
jgi:predicted cupin superfamily sugar epimerase